MRRPRTSRIAVAAIGTVVVLTGAVVTAPSAFATTSANLIKNGTAEAKLGTPVPGWKLTTGTTFEAVQYGVDGFPELTDPGPANRGHNLLAGGSGEPLEVATQSRSLAAYATSIAAGTAKYALLGYLGGFSDQRDNATLSITFYDASNVALTSAQIGPVTPGQRKDASGLLKRKAAGAVPTTAASVTVTLTLKRFDGAYNDGYADNLSLKITTP